MTSQNKAVYIDSTKVVNILSHSKIVYGDMLLEVKLNVTTIKITTSNKLPNEYND